MLSRLLISTVDFSRRFALIIIIAALISGVAMAGYVRTHIKINTDINQLLSDKLAWRQREKAIDRAFPQKIDTLVIVIDGKTGDKAEAAAAVLADKLKSMPDKFSYVSRPDALPFFRDHGLLYLSDAQLGAMLDQIAQAQPLLGVLVSDPSLRGFFGTIALMMQGVAAGVTDPAQLQKPLEAIADTLNATLAGTNKPLELSKLMPQNETSLDPHELRKFILTKPILDYSSLQPGAVPTQAVRSLIQSLGLTEQNGVHVRLTGPVPLNDEEFASVADGTGFATLLCAGLVIVLLFLALRTWRIVVPIILTLCMGLITSTAFATVAVGSLNLISVAFAVMFIGIAVDFGIQFGIRYRDQRHLYLDHAVALSKTASVIAVPLAMAAASTALGFLSFIPTDYRGVSELGLIAGVGMLIAFFLNVTLLPALMTLTKPSPEAEGIGFAWLSPLNEFLRRQHLKILPFIALLTIAGIAVAIHVRFDFDPLDLKSPKSESVSTMFDVMQDPDSDAYAAEILEPSQSDAEAIAAQLAKLPEVDHTMSFLSFIPTDQEKKLAMIADAGALLAPTFSLAHKPPASDADNIDAMRTTANALHQAGDKILAVKNLADTLDKFVAAATPTLLQNAQNAIIAPLQSKLGDIQSVVQTRPVSLNDIPDDLKKDWVTSDGRWLVEIFPKRSADNNPRDPQTLNAFIEAVQKRVPEATGAPVSIHESGKTIISAFVHAGIYGLISIAILSFVALRRKRDVLLMLTPLVIAGILTLATITLIGMPLNFANIIAMPLLFSLGVSYAVYFVFYAQTGQTDFLQSSMARAVLFSACTVLVAFMSLCFSGHPGTHGMGELLTIALLFSLVCTFLMLPVLLAPAREDKH